MVGAGVKKFEQSERLTENIIPKKCKWIQDSVKTFQPEQNRVIMKSGKQVCKSDLYPTIEALLGSFFHLQHPIPFYATSPF